MSNIGDYDAVVAGAAEDFPTTPDILRDPDFRGILIAGPDEVPLDGPEEFDGSFTRMIVCGALHIDSNYLGLREDFLDAVLLVAVNTSNHTPYIAPLPGVPNAIPLPDSLEGIEVTASDWEGRSVVLFFNENLVSALGIPKVAAEYVVYATLGQYVSNVIRMRVA